MTCVAASDVRAVAVDGIELLTPQSEDEYRCAAAVQWEAYGEEGDVPERAVAALRRDDHSDILDCRPGYDVAYVIEHDPVRLHGCEQVIRLNPRGSGGYGRCQRRQRVGALEVPRGTRFAGPPFPFTGSEPNPSTVTPGTTVAPGCCLRRLSSARGSQPLREATRTSRSDSSVPSSPTFRATYSQTKGPVSRAFVSSGGRI